MSLRRYVPHRKSPMLPPPGLVEKEVDNNSSSNNNIAKAEEDEEIWASEDEEGEENEENYGLSLSSPSLGGDDDYPQVYQLLTMGKGGTITQMGLAGIDLGASPIRTQQERDKMIKRMSQRLIYMRCTDGAVISFCFVCGFLAIFMQVVSLSTEHWLLTIEPRPINLTDELGHQKGLLLDFLRYSIESKKNGENSKQTMVRFQYHSGYWRVCRTRFVPLNETLGDEELYIYTHWPQFQRMCMWNQFFKENVLLGKESRVTAAIMSRVQLSSIVHVFGLLGTIVATVLSIVGYCNRNHKTLYSGIIYINGGLAIAVAVMQYICVVDDEMAPRMKPNAQGEPSKYAFSYGYSFLGGALSFLVIQTCAICQLILFFRRYPGIEGKLEIVPGLKEKIHRAKMDRELGMLPPPTPKKGNLPNTDYASPHHTQHSAGDHSFTFDAQTNKWGFDFTDTV